MGGGKKGKGKYTSYNAWSDWPSWGKGSWGSGTGWGKQSDFKTNDYNLRKSIDDLTTHLWTQEQKREYEVWQAQEKAQWDVYQKTEDEKTAKLAAERAAEAKTVAEAAEKQLKATNELISLQKANQTRFPAEASGSGGPAASPRGRVAHRDYEDYRHGFDRYEEPTGRRGHYGAMRGYDDYVASPRDRYMSSPRDGYYDGSEERIREAEERARQAEIRERNARRDLDEARYAEEEATREMAKARAAAAHANRSKGGGRPPADASTPGKSSGKGGAGGIGAGKGSTPGSGFRTPMNFARPASSPSASVDPRAAAAPSMKAPRDEGLRGYGGSEWWDPLSSSSKRARSPPSPMRGGSSAGVGMPANCVDVDLNADSVGFAFIQIIQDEIPELAIHYDDVPFLMQLNTDELVQSMLEYDASWKRICTRLLSKNPRVGSSKEELCRASLNHLAKKFGPQ